MKIYKIIKQISINDVTGERKERYAVIQTYTTFIERVVTFLTFESSNPIYSYSDVGYSIRYSGNNVFNTIEEARECIKKLEKPLVTYTHKEEVIE